MFAIGSLGLGDDDDDDAKEHAMKSTANRLIWNRSSASVLVLVEPLACLL